jgi:hypothetical protein
MGDLAVRDAAEVSVHRLHGGLVLRGGSGREEMRNDVRPLDFPFGSGAGFVWRWDRLRIAAVGARTGCGGVGAPATPERSETPDSIRTIRAWRFWWTIMAPSRDPLANDKVIWTTRMSSFS